MKLIYKKNQLKNSINSMNGRVVTLNNEYLYLLNNSQMQECYHKEYTQEYTNKIQQLVKKAS